MSRQQAPLLFYLLLLLLLLLFRCCLLASSVACGSATVDSIAQEVNAYDPLLTPQ